MKTIKTEINLYEYDELKTESKEKAFNEHLDFLMSVQMEDENLNEMSENDLKEYVEDSIRINEYLFFESGEMAHITHFTGKHEKTGITEFYFNGKVYVLN